MQRRPRAGARRAGSNGRGNLNPAARAATAALPVCKGYGKLAARFDAPCDGTRVRKSFRLLPLSLCIALALPAHAADDGEDWRLCPITPAVPPTEPST